MKLDGQDNIGGKPVTDKQIVEWANEAEAGYDFANLKKRGRPRFGTDIAKVATLRLNSKLDAALSERRPTRSHHAK